MSNNAGSLSAQYKSHRQSEFDDELMLLSEHLPSGSMRTAFSVPGIRCGGCVAKIEEVVSKVAGIKSARANLTLKRLHVEWDSAHGLSKALSELRTRGFDASLVDESDTSGDDNGKRYLRATAVAGFAAGNIMMLSVAVWAGADAVTQQLFHTISAVLAVLAVIYSGSIFFASAWSVLVRGRTNMDVPISIGIILAVLLGLYDTVEGGGAVYFEAATMLIFFLLVGRTLDDSMRRRANSSLGALSRIAPRTALRLPDSIVQEYSSNDDIAANGVLDADSHTERVSVESVKVGSYLLVPTGIRLPLDAVIVSGESEFDTSIVDGEPLPKFNCAGDSLDAGVKNLGAPIIVKVRNLHEHSFLRRTQRLVDDASSVNSQYRSLSDRVAQWYAPFVHLAALAAGLFWSVNGANLHEAVTIAISVLIITCPCALGLAVPMVQVLSGAKLVKHGVVMKNGTALERVGNVDSIVFDKTGTLTQKVASIETDIQLDGFHTAVLQALAASSSHPFARSIGNTIAHAQSIEQAAKIKVAELELSDVQEYAGKGVQGTYNGIVYRLGKPTWCNNTVTGIDVSSKSATSCFSVNGVLTATFVFKESLRSDTITAVSLLKNSGCEVYIASGDQTPGVKAIAEKLAIRNTLGNASPEQKSDLVESLKSGGRKVMMVGDGINDTVALSKADVSFAMGDAGDISASCADFVLMHNRLESIHTVRLLALKAQKLMRQNIALAIVYNLIAMPLAFAGIVSPLIAAIAMSTSSLLVIGNSLRLNRQSMAISKPEKNNHLESQRMSKPLLASQL